jgi:L-ascorbate metabolism protein UlaG (beta-lactamase superfamily)
MNLLARPYDDSSLSRADRVAIARFNRPLGWFTSVLLPLCVGLAALLAPSAGLTLLSATADASSAALLQLCGALLMQRAVLTQYVRARLELKWIYAFLIATVPLDLTAGVVVLVASFHQRIDPAIGWCLAALLLALAGRHGALLLRRFLELRASRWRNVAGVTWTQPILPLLWWRLERIWKRRRGSLELPRVVDPVPDRLADIAPHLTWIGHATFVMRLGRALVATDPIWRGQLYYMPRLRPPGVPIDRLPGLDVVTVTHNHYDHLDLGTLVELKRRYDPTFVVPRNNGWILRRSGIERVVELEWWQSHRVRDLEITLVPAQHWSQRGPLDTNIALWGGYVYRSAEGTAYHAGDTAFEPLVFQQIAERYRVDWAMMPISAYEPEWFLRTQHINPEDAGRAFDLLGAKRFVAMHYGTYELTDEPVGEPIERTRTWFAARGQIERLWALDIGETRTLSPER